MKLRENNYNSIENIKKRLADGAQPHPISHTVLIKEIDRLNQIIEDAYKFLQEDMEMCARYLLCPPGSQESKELKEACGDKE